MPTSPPAGLAQGSPASVPGPGAPGTHFPAPRVPTPNNSGAGGCATAPPFPQDTQGHVHTSKAASPSHPFFPLHVVPGCCVAFAEPSGWCAGAVPVAADAVCALVVPNSWCAEVVLVVAGVVRRFLLPTHLRFPPVVHNLHCCVLVCMRPKCPTPPPSPLPTTQSMRLTGRPPPALHHSVGRTCE